jgi:uncharacterized paraquat-inducible protein A
MARYREDDDAWDDDDIDTEEADESTITCDYCREEIHEDSQRCPHCGTYISEEDSPPTRKPWWIYVGVAICLLIVYLWIKRGM